MTPTDFVVTSVILIEKLLTSVHILLQTLSWDSYLGRILLGSCNYDTEIKAESYFN